MTVSRSRMLAAATALAALLAGCGGGPDAPAAAVPAPEQPAPVPPTPTPTPPTPPPPAPAPAPDPVPPPEPAPPVEKPLSVFQTSWNLCAAPRTGLDPSGHPYPDRQGTLADELHFLRGWADEFYLWYSEIPAVDAAAFNNPVDYFNQLKTPAITASGRAKDRYHFSYTTERWDAISGSGIDVGYGVTWSRNTGPNLPRTWIATLVEPGSPADAAQLRRGDLLLAVDGIDFVNAGDKASVATINAALFPAGAGEAHRLTVGRGGASIDVALTSASVRIAAVKYTRTIDTPTGKVGYLSFENHSRASEQQLIASVAQLKAAGITDLVLDVRYNGGGLLYIASELAYMIAGPAATSGKVFEQGRYSDKIPAQPPLTFRSTAFGYSAPGGASAGQALPYLGLKRVTLLTTAGTCSASESIANSLRGVDVEVTLIGGQTCGKPYAFTPTPNCGTTYFSIEFQGVNDKGFGDYADGMAPTCSVPDDLSHAVGDPAEGMLAAALKYRASGSCPAGAAARAQSAPLQLVRPEAAEIAIHSRR